MPFTTATYHWSLFLARPNVCLLTMISLLLIFNNTLSLSYESLAGAPHIKAPMSRAAYSHKEFLLSRQAAKSASYGALISFSRRLRSARRLPRKYMNGADIAREAMRARRLVDDDA